MSDINVLQYINDVLSEEYLKDKIIKQEVFGVSAKEIADHYNQYRSNISALLNDGVKANIFIKIESRPVLFVPKALLEKTFHLPINQSSYTTDTFVSYFYGLENNEQNEPFEPFVGYNSSQETQVQQAQSAILYPPNGLHTLITGESGTGKTLFARTMYAFGLQAKNKSEKSYPFVEFNCADYFHNPQLLLSQLFGHIKGAFTGATQESVGLVEKANGGILFLDEIHRLPPEGQELLFYLMDTGQYRKLGEANSVRKANVLIIGATTEDPNDVLLKTFKRRIPLSIQLPAYRDRPLKERLQIIEQLFLKESIVTQRTYLIDSSVVKALAHYDFPANIGQLASEIKILCARSFLENRSKGLFEITIPYDFLATNIKAIYKKTKKKHEAFDDELVNYNFDMIISPSNPIAYQKDTLLNEQSYHNLIDEINTYISRGLTGNELAKETNTIITEYYNDVLERTYFKEINKEEVYKIVDRDIVDFSIELMKDIHENLRLDITQQHILVLAFHIKFLIDRVNDGKKLTTKNKKIVIDEPLVENIITKIESKYQVVLPNDEREFFRLLIKNMANDNTTKKSELYILAHGNTATSIADVCNRLMNTTYVKALDAPLEQDIEKTYERFLNEVEKSRPKNGIIILADMGSLLQFGERISAQTGIITHTIANVSTAIALDFTHIMLNRNEHVDLIYNEYLMKNRNASSNNSIVKKPIIISSCSSGMGTSVAFQATIENLLKENELDFIEVHTLSNADLQNKSDAFLELERNYTILAIVGNVHLTTNKPFFHISTMVSKDKEGNFITFIKNATTTSIQNEPPTHNQEEVIQFLEKHVMYINPVAAAKVATKFINQLFTHEELANKDITAMQTSLIIHLGFMMERIVVDKRIQFDNKEDFINANPSLYTMIKEEISIIEDSFVITIHDDEICYMIVALLENRET